MAEAGNPAAKDHNALLADLDSIVQALTSNNDDMTMTERQTNFDVPSLEFYEGLWSDVDCVEFLDTSSQWAS